MIIFSSRLMLNLNSLLELSSYASTQVPINPYGKAKKMAEDIILDFSKRSDMAVMILRCKLELVIRYCWEKQ